MSATVAVPVLVALVALIELGVIVWLWISRRNARRNVIELTLRARRAELRAMPDIAYDLNWLAIPEQEESSERPD